MVHEASFMKQRPRHNHDIAQWVGRPRPTSNRARRWEKASRKATLSHAVCLNCRVGRSYKNVSTEGFGLP